jgi:hypothetical protein
VDGFRVGNLVALGSPDEGNTIRIRMTDTVRT